MTLRRPIHCRRCLVVLGGLVAALGVCGGCYRHVVGAKGPGASAYEIQDPADKNTVIMSELKPAPKSNLTKGGKPVAH